MNRPQLERHCIFRFQEEQVVWLIIKGEEPLCCGFSRLEFGLMSGQDYTQVPILVLTDRQGHVVDAIDRRFSEHCTFTLEVHYRAKGSRPDKYTPLLLAWTFTGCRKFARTEVTQLFLEDMHVVDELILFFDHDKQQEWAMDCGGSAVRL